MTVLVVIRNDSFDDTNITYFSQPDVNHKN